MKNISLKNLFNVCLIALVIAVTFFTVSAFTDDRGIQLGAVALNTLAEKELIKHFRHEDTWLQEVPDKNAWVNNDVIKLTAIGADPEVLINNTTYPIAIVGRVDDSTAVSLYKFDTVNTPITDDEIYALPYDKAGSVQEQHREYLEERTAEMGLHSLAVQENTATTPVIETTGADDGTGRKRLTSIDLINFKKILDDLKVPKKGRVLVLCSAHVADLLIEDRAFEKQYHNATAGVLATNYYGFKVYETVYAPVYGTDNKKKAFSAAPAGTDRPATVAFYAPRTAKARGSVKRYMREAAGDPEFRRTVVGFRLYHIVIPTKNSGFGAIISGVVEEEG